MSKRCFLPWLRPWGAEFPPIISACLLLLWGVPVVPPAARAAEEEGFLQQARKLEKARNADSAWKPKYKEEKPIKVTVKGGSVNNFCLSRDGQLLVCVGLSEVKDKGVCELQVLTPSGKLVKKVPLPFNPQAVCTDDQGFIYVGGGGKLCKLSSEHKILEEKPVPALQVPAEEQNKWKAQMKEELQRLRKEYAEMNPHLPKADLERMLQEAQKSVEKRRGDVTGLAVVGRDLFVATPSPAAFGYMVWKVDARLSQPKAVITRLSGCCGQMDIRGHDGKLWVAHNGKHKVECYQPNGTMVSSFGRSDLVAADGFGGCCEPKNLCFAPNGDILAAESGPPVVVKRFTATGQFVGVLALPTYKSGCVRATVAISADNNTIYLLNPGDNAIHVFSL
ncbi:hypothetical protein NXS98_00325 [Fontisphaera persica]|uniref:hypothetical protein n=1 Tax=Fontisphaera persica TaxID=2974023 RepID=UPI0024C0845A|nr:hypothetical protein [Fontisphaera persica]WCJ59596.1 hypothetical protein NXS98_00325 [Fontisphaera persica]